MIQRTLSFLATFSLAVTLHAQSVSLPDGETIQPLVTLTGSHQVGGLDVDSSGDLFYLDVDGSGTDTHLYERTATGTVTDLYDLPVANIYGLTVRVRDNEAFFAYATFSGSYTVVAGTLGSAGQQLQNPRILALPVQAYDFAFSPNGTAYVSAYSNGNHVYEADTTTGTLTPRVSIPNDFSGPITFSAAGDLLYGTTKFDTDPGAGLYLVPAAALTGSEFTLAPAQRLQANGGNGYLTEGAGLLYDATFSSVLTGYEQDGAGMAFTAATASSGLNFSNLAFGTGEVYANVTDFGSGNYIFELPIPEPATGGMVLSGLGLLLRRRRA